MKNSIESIGSTASSCPFASKAAVNDNDDGSEGAENEKLNSSSSYASFGSCPFAQALHNDSGDDSSSTISADHSSGSTMMAHPASPGSLPWKECPVFANRSCPFKDVKSPDDISQILMQLPASHTDQSRPTHAVLIETLAYFHRDKAIEEYSFSSILTRLVKEHHARQSQEGISVDEDHSSFDGEDSTADEYPVLAMPNTEKEGEHDLRTPAGASNTACIERKQQRRLSDALKTGTEEAHREAESVHFVKNFIRGKIDRRMYALFVAQLFHVYRHLETALDKHAAQFFPECHFPKELNRTEALREDIDFWQGSSVEPPISPATQDYLDRIDEVARKRPLLLLAHAYTRYLGDLSGGKILARVAKRALNLEKGVDGVTDGLAFYDFPLLRGSVKAFKDKYRQALNDLRFEDADEAVHAIVQEANVAFLLNMRLFEELDVKSSVPGATIRPIEQVYSHVAKMNVANEMMKEDKLDLDKSSCPFVNTNGSSTGSHSHYHKSEGKRCPWPFILLHDPVTGMKEWQTWMVIGLIAAFLYQQHLNVDVQA